MVGEDQSAFNGVHMYFNVFFQEVVLFLVVFVLAVPATAGEPTGQMKETIDKAISILSDPALKDPNRSEERRRLIRRVADERFNWEEMARRALAEHWKKVTDEDKKEFVRLFADLLERTYMKRIENYSGDKVIYERERIEGNYSIVGVKIYTSKNAEIPVEYRLRKHGSNWLIYDVSIEGISLVSNYRSQFSNVLQRSSYAELLAQLRKKVDGN
jgi:phospholipid transport system substrate-binding protein